MIERNEALAEELRKVAAALDRLNERLEAVGLALAKGISDVNSRVEDLESEVGSIRIDLNELITVVAPPDDSPPD